MTAEGIVLVTGGSRGIGAATATLLAEQGRRVVIIDIAPEPLAGTQHDPVAGAVRCRQRKRRRQRHRRYRGRARPDHRPRQCRRRVRQDASDRAGADGSMGPRGQYRPARHVSGRPQRRRADGRAPARRHRQCRLRRRHDLRSDPRLYRRESRRHPDHADARRRMGPRRRARQCGLAGLHPHRRAGSRHRLRRAEQATARKPDGDEPAGRADRSRAGDRVAAVADEQRRHRHQPAGRCRLYRGTTWAAYGGLREAPSA